MNIEHRSIQIGDKVKIKYSGGVTVGVVDRLEGEFLHFNSRGMGGVEILKRTVKPLSETYRGAVWCYQSFN